MKKILLLGNLNETLQSISDCLCEDFQVQMASEDPEIAKNMIRLSHPDLIVFSQVGVEDDEPVFEMLKECLQEKQRPILGVATPEGRRHMVEYKELFSDMDYVCRPITKYGLIDACNKMLGIKKKDGAEGVSGGRRRGKAPSKKAKKATIMVVDDSELALRRIERLLRDQYEVYPVTDGKEALKELEACRPDVILLDYNMPGWDGRTTFDMIKKDPLGEKIPVIFLTGVKDRQNIYRALELNPYGYILKPVEPDMLLDKIKEALQGGKV